MYFMTEGIAEEITKRKFKPQKFRINKGDFFGEVSFTAISV